MFKNIKREIKENSEFFCFFSNTLSSREENLILEHEIGIQFQNLAILLDY
jgi:hypothetical protein